MTMEEMVARAVHRSEITVAMVVRFIHDYQGSRTGMASSHPYVVGFGTSGTTVGATVGGTSGVTVGATVTPTFGAGVVLLVTYLSTATRTGSTATRAVPTDAGISPFAADNGPATAAASPTNHANPFSMALRFKRTSSSRTKQQLPEPTTWGY